MQDPVTIRAQASQVVQGRPCPFAHPRDRGAIVMHLYTGFAKFTAEQSDRIQTTFLAKQSAMNSDKGGLLGACQAGGSFPLQMQDELWLAFGPFPIFGCQRHGITPGGGAVFHDLEAR